MLGEKREYLTIQILHNDMTVKVPDRERRPGRPPHGDRRGRWSRRSLKALHGCGTAMPKNWNRRFKHNRDKMKTGDIFELAEVVRNLSLRDHEKGLSTGEKQMFVKAKKILASELMYAKEMDEEEAAESARRRPRHRRATARRRRPRSPRPQAPSARRRARVSVWAVLAAAGRGERLGADRPKAFAPLRGRPLLAESLERLEASELDRRRSSSSRRPSWEEPVILARRGARLRQGRRVRHRRRDARRVGADRRRRRSATDAAVILVHDAARPLVSDEVVERRADAALARAGTERFRACRSSTRSSASDGEAVVETLARGELVAVQTPQAFVAPTCCAARSRRVCLGGDGLRVARRGARRPGAGRRGRPAAAEGDDARGPRARRVLARGCDRRLPHAPPRPGRADRAHGRGGRAVRRDRGRARRRRDRLHRARLLLPRRRVPVWTLPYQLERCVYDLDAVRRRGRRGEAAGPAGQARARGRLRRRAAGRARGRCSSRTRGTTCSARCTGSTGSRSTRSRASGRTRSVDEVVAALLRGARPSSPASGHVDVLAHPDLAKIFGRRPARGSSTRRSTASRSRSRPPGCTSRSASCTRTRRCSQSARLPITLASDAHVPQNVGRDLDRAVELARAAGYDTVTVFEGRTGAAGAARMSAPSRDDRHEIGAAP